MTGTTDKKATKKKAPAKKAPPGEPTADPTAVPTRPPAGAAAPTQGEDDPTPPHPPPGPSNPNQILPSLADLLQGIGDPTGSGPTQSTILSPPPSDQKEANKELRAIRAKFAYLNREIVDVSGVVHRVDDFDFGAFEQQAGPPAGTSSLGHNPFSHSVTPPTSFEQFKFYLCC